MVLLRVADQVQGVRVRFVGETSVNVTWGPLDSLDVSNYQVYYTRGSKKRQGDLVIEERMKLTDTLVSSLMSCTSKQDFIIQDHFVWDVYTTPTLNSLQ